MPLMSSLALIRPICPLEGQVLLRKLTQKSSSLGMRSAAVSTMKPMLRASLPREGTCIGLEVFSSTCQPNVGYNRTGTPRETDS